ncbi:TetR/AcrR family transcriptional regulator [Rugamonas sp.]|uniref:TetR/AcrR family transcriptional regulator n=1 Tax=Rugamonas sp. TaxID=1926287 RepID=UPI0025D1E302|nr:TetR/AcrR family transcriptional regulator [Rugamonas sp.]
MGRKKLFSRESVLDKAIPVFWAKGYADTSLQDLELATGVNKSGLYSEFKDKEDLFLASLSHYQMRQMERGLLTEGAPGWNNIERLLKLGYSPRDGEKGCFSVRLMPDLGILPARAHDVMTASQAGLKLAIAANIEAETTRLPAAVLADMVVVFFFGICIDQNLETDRAETTRKIDHFMTMLRAS